MELDQSSITTKNEEDEKEVAGSKLSKYYDIIATLPSHRGWASSPYYKYGNFWGTSFSLAASMAFQQEFNPLPSDIFLATYPKTGTTWLKALSFAILNRARFAIDHHHPLLTSSPHNCVPFVEDYYYDNTQVNDSYVCSPRLLAMHFPYSALPLSVTNSGCRIIYLCRDPKDAFISLWHFLNNYVKVTFNEAFEMFCEGVSFRGPISEHILEYWNASLRHPSNILFLKYEELQAEPVKNVIRLAEFVGHPFSEEEMKKGVADEIVKLCSFETLSKAEGNVNGQQIAGPVSFQNSSYFRKGKVGDWKEHLNPEMAKKLDDIIEQKLEGSGLTFRN